MHGRKAATIEIDIFGSETDKKVHVACLNRIVNWPLSVLHGNAWPNLKPKIPDTGHSPPQSSAFPLLPFCGFRILHKHKGWVPGSGSIYQRFSTKFWEGFRFPVPAKTLRKLLGSGSGSLEDRNDGFLFHLKGTRTLRGSGS